MSDKYVANISLQEVPHLSKKDKDSLGSILLTSDEWEARIDGVPAGIKTKPEITALSDSELLDLAQALQVLDEKYKYCKQEFIFPKYLKTPGYKKHLLFMKAGSVYKERALIAGNRTGKTYTATLEMSFHLNGRYPKGWEGKEFRHPIKAWEIGKTHETTAQILQTYLLGNRYDLGTGFIPKEDIVRV